MPVRTNRGPATTALRAGALALGTGARGDDDSGGAPDPGSAADPGEVAEDLEDAQAQQGGGSATLAIGAETWGFDSVVCAIGSDQTQSEEWDFSLSAIHDGLQLTADGAAEDGQYGGTVEIDDIEDSDNPSVSWSAPGFRVTGEVDDDFVDVDGKQVTAEAEFSDNTADDPSAALVPGTLVATCP